MCNTTKTKLQCSVQIYNHYKMDHEDMKKLFKQIPTMKSKSLSHDKKIQLPLTDIGGEWYLTHLEAWIFFKSENTNIFYQWGVIKLLCVT